MPNIKLIMDEVKKIVAYSLCYMEDLKLDKYTDYQHIIGMWNFHKLISPHHNKSNLIVNEKNIKLFGGYYQKHKFIRDCFSAHTNAVNNHLILFYIKDNENVLLCYKSKRRKEKGIDPYLRLIIPLRQFNIRMLNINDIGDKVVRMLFFAD